MGVESADQFAEIPKKLKTRSSFGPVKVAEHDEQTVKRGIFR
jgi:hypothetical protein